MKIPLFDIDGTLFETGSALHHAAFSYAFKAVYGIDAKINEVEPEGMIDNQIILEVLKLHGLNEKDIKEKIKLATDAMTNYFIDNEQNVNPKILPGVNELLKKIKDKNIPLGMLTGNVEEIAWTKIERAGIKKYFNFGAFGDKAFKRVELVELAKQNANKVLNKNYRIKDFLIIGDTARDVVCARKAGIKVILVATGFYTFVDLEKENADLLVHTLEEKNKILKFLEN